jgi:hypothetical protein
LEARPAVHGVTVTVVDAVTDSAIHKWELRGSGWIGSLIAGGKRRVVVAGLGAQKGTRLIPSLVYVCDVDAGNILQQCEPAQQYDHCYVALSGSGERLAVSDSRVGSSVKNTDVTVWGVDSKSRICDLHLRLGALCMSLDFAGKLLAVIEMGNGVTIWDADRGVRLRRLSEEENWSSRALCFADDGRMLAVGEVNRRSHEGRTRLWEIESGMVRAEYGGHEGAVTALAFSHDVKLLASGSSDTTVVLWDLIGRRNKRKEFGEPLRDGNVWAALASDDARLAFRAMAALEQDPRAAVRVLQSGLETASPDVAALEACVRDLDDDRFVVRERAAERLRMAGKWALPLLQRALGKENSAEKEQRLRKLLAELQSAATREGIRGIRAVEVLEHIGTREASSLLERVATGPPDAELTRQAKSSLRRLAGQTSIQRNVAP